MDQPSVGSIPCESWAKRLRVTKSRSVKIPEQSHPNHPPGSWPTNPSNTGNAQSSSSAGKTTDQKQNVVHTLRDRLAPVPKKHTYLSSSGITGAIKKDSTKSSVAPFFRRIEAAFRDNQKAATETDRVVSSKTNPLRSPSPDAEDLIQQLKG